MHRVNPGFAGQAGQRERLALDSIHCFQGSTEPAWRLPLEGPGEKETQQLSGHVFDGRLSFGQSAIQLQAERVGKTTTKHSRPWRQRERLGGPIEPRSVDFQIEQKPAIAVELIGVRLVAGMPDHRAGGTSAPIL